MNAFGRIIEKLTSKLFSKRDINDMTSKTFEGGGPVEVTKNTYEKYKLLPSVNGYKKSSGTSGTMKELPQSEEKPFNDQMKGDSRNTPIEVMADGTMVDNRPQSWENTTRRIRNGVPSDSDLVSKIAFDPNNQTLSAETKRGSYETVPDDGSQFAEFEAAGSKGRHAVASGNVSF